MTNQSPSPADEVLAREILGWYDEKPNKDTVAETAKLIAAHVVGQAAEAKLHTIREIKRNVEIADNVEDFLQVMDRLEIIAGDALLPAPTNKEIK